jgi:hypothetical protein
MPCIATPHVPVQGILRSAYTARSGARGTRLQSAQPADLLSPSKGDAMKISLYDAIAKTHADNAQIIADALDRIGVVREIDDRELTLVQRINTVAKVREAYHM